MPISKPLLPTLLKSTILSILVFGTLSFVSALSDLTFSLQRIVILGKIPISGHPKNFPKNIRIIAKYLTLDEKMSVQGHFCDNDSIRPFLKMKALDCMFQINDHQFKIDNKLVLDKHGKVVQYYRYLPMGLLIYNRAELYADSGLVNSLKLNPFFIQISADKTRIMDTQDTCEIEKIYPKEKLMMMKQTEQLKNKGQRIFYQYSMK